MTTTETSSGRTAGPVPLLVLDRESPDPFAFRRDGMFHVTGTAGVMLRTRDFTTPTQEWLDLKLDFGRAHGRVHNVWAFRIYEHVDGSLHAYGSCHYGGFRTVVSHFVPADGEKWTADHPVLSWRLDKVLVGDLDKGVLTYDGNVYRDEKGELYLFYCVAAPARSGPADIDIVACRMKDPGNIDPAFRPRVVLSGQKLRSEDRNPGFIQLVEGAVVQELGGKYVLFYSVGDFMLDNYKIGVAFSDAMMPPEGRQYEKVLIPDPDNLWKNDRADREVKYLLQSQIPEWPNYIGRHLCGPGIGSIVELAGRQWLLFHGQPYGSDGRPAGRRVLWRIPVKIDISDSVPRERWIVPDLSAGEGAPN